MTKARIGDADFLASAAEKANLREAKSGNPLAIQKLFVSYQRLFCYAWQKYHPADLSLHDWLANMYQLLYQVVLHYDDQQNASFGHYLYRSLENFAKGQYRKCRAQKRIPADCLVSLSDQLPIASQESMEERIYCRLIFENFLDYDLSNFEREVLVASLFMDMPALCKKFGCHQRTIQSALSRCRKKLILALQA